MKTAICVDRSPYTYLIGWSSHNMFYYGRRTAKGCKPEDLWVDYFSSSKYVSRFIDIYGQPDIIEVRRAFQTINSCELWEQKVLSRLIMKSPERYLNKSTATGKMSTTGCAPAKVVTTGENIGLVSLSDVRWSTGEIVGVNKGSTLDRISIARRGTFPMKTVTGLPVGSHSPLHPNFISGEWISIRRGTKHKVASINRNSVSNKNRITIRTPDGYIKVTRDDPRVILYGGTTKGNKWIRNPLTNIELNLPRDETQQYIEQGWELGRKLNLKSLNAIIN